MWPLGSTLLAFRGHKIQFVTQFYSATVRYLEMFVRQLCTKSESGMQNTGKGWEFIMHESAGCT